jgi:hypothetical protein
VSDELDLAAESAAAEAEPSTPEAPDAPPPWGDNFDADRAWRTITHLRDRERELESSAKALQRLQEDETALREFLAEKGYELPEEDDDDLTDEDDDDPIAPLRSQVQSIEEYIAEQRAERAVDGFAKHLGQLAKDAELDLSDRDKQIVFRDALDMKGGLNKANTEAAFKAHTDYLRSYESRVREGWQQRKKAPTPATTTGQSATQVPDLDDAASRQAWMIEQMANRDAG